MHTDVLIIGTGQAGVPLAKKLADAGKKVVIVERGQVGGTCINVGCTPTKTLIASAQAAHVARTAGELGVHTGEVRVDLAKVMARKDGIVSEWRDGIRTSLEGNPAITLLRGHARFAGPREIEVEGRRYSAELVVINVGARPFVPPTPGLAEVAHLDNASLLELKELPEHLVVLGGGYIGCEFAQAFRRFGSKVTIVDLAPHLAAREDDDVCEALEGVFRQEGIALELGQKVQRVEGKAGDVALVLEGGRRVAGTHLLAAVGRVANTGDLGCDRAGIKLDPRGNIVVDEWYRTSVEGVYAVGDCTGGPQFTHASWDDHRLLFEHLMGRGTRSRNDRLVPYTAFTDPQVAGVGLNEKAAKAQKVPYEVASVPFGYVARAIETARTAGLMKVLVDPATERILGASVLGAEAGELIHVFVTLMVAKATARAIVDAEFVHPTYAEGLQQLVMALKRYQ